MDAKEKEWILTHLVSGEENGTPWIWVPIMPNRRFTAEEIIKVLLEQKEAAS